MSVGISLTKRMRSTPPVRLVVISFLIIIIMGALLLMLPVCSRSGQGTRFLDALFTSVSAVCVTGLTRFDTWSHWSGTGQAVLLFLIQIGGLGITTYTTGFALLLRHKVGFRELSMARENLQGEDLNIARLLRMILTVTFVAEVLGALLLMLRFVPLYGAYGIWISVFHSISAYCGAGFDIMGFRAPFASLAPYAGDALVILPLYLLSLVGGLGFVVISDIYYAKIKRRFTGAKPAPLNFHSQIVLISEAALLGIGTLMYFLLEQSHSLKNMDWMTRLSASWFQANSIRTAGFTIMDFSQQDNLTKMLSLVLSFIGAAPCSTGGGIRTTTLVVLAAAVASVMRGNEETVLRHRMISHAVVYRALTIFTGGLVTVFVTASVILMSNAGHDMGTMAALQEAVAAFSTIGIGSNLAPWLSDASLYALMVAMFIGRVGLVSLGLSVAARHGHGIKSSSVLPEGRIIVG